MSKKFPKILLEKRIIVLQELKKGFFNIFLMLVAEELTHYNNNTFLIEN